MNDLEKVDAVESTIDNNVEATEETTVTTETTDEKDPRRFHTLDKEGLLNEIRNIVAENRMEAHKDVTALKQAFFNIKTKENLDNLNAFIDAGNNPSDYVAEVDELENEFKNLYTEFKEKRAAFLLADEENRKKNLEKKNEILEKLKGITEDIDNINMRFPEFQQLQQEFKAIKEIPAGAEAEVWKKFQSIGEQFYDHLKMNKDLRDLDFKKNLEAKKALIEEARKLETNEDVIDAFRRLQGLHDEWRNIGPVAKELRDEIWEEFKAASTIVNRRHQDFFEQRKAIEQANEEAKTALCEKVEALDWSGLKTFAEWNAMTEDVIALQKDWKECGFASRKVNAELYARFREACDKFFTAKADFFRATKDTLTENLALKTRLCEKAEALKELGDVHKAAGEIVKLQAEWKKIGSVPRKQSDAIWERFQTACNYFFEERKKENKKRHEEETANLETKRGIIAELQALPKDGDRREVIGKVKELQAKWQEVGFVPFKLKEKLYQEYRAVCDELYGAYESRENRNRISNFQNRVAELKDDSRGLGRERDKLMRALEAKQQELKTIENNMGFFSVKSSAGNSMLKEMERKVKRLKDDMAEIKQKIEILKKGE